MTVSSLDETLARGRAAAETLMVDTCVVKRRTGQTLDPATDALVASFDTVYDGKCRVKSAARLAHDQVVGEQNLSLNRFEVDLPFGTADVVKVDDVVNVTASADTWVVDRDLVVLAVDYSGTVTKRKLIVEDHA